MRIPGLLSADSGFFSRGGCLFSEDLRVGMGTHPPLSPLWKSIGSKFLTGTGQKSFSLGGRTQQVIHRLSTEGLGLPEFLQVYHKHR